MHASLAPTAVVLVISLGATAAQSFEELHAFTGYLDGGVPMGGLVQGSDGNFYGTTFWGGAYVSRDFPSGAGTVFKITPDGLFTTIASFNGTNNGQHPYGTLVQASDGNFYGTTFDGAIFRVTPGGVITSTGGAGASDDVGDLMQGSDGYLYGADAYYGILYWTSLDWRGGGWLYTQGRPTGGLIQAKDGNFYGLTGSGGTGGFGTIYRLTPGHTMTTVASFSRGPNGWYAVSPYDRLLQGSDGSFYGVADAGYYGLGAIFRLTASGILTTLASLDGWSGEDPNGGLIEARDGNFYGTARRGSTNIFGSGTVFRMTPDGTITALVMFSGLSGPYPGATPYAGLVEGKDGNLYGTTGTLGSRGNGNIFRIIMPGPQLRGSKTGTDLVLSWRTNYVGFTLQSSVGVSLAAWMDCTNAAVISGGHFWVTNPISGSAQFFRLSK